MTRMIDPKVELIDYGPSTKLEDGTLVVPDDFIYGAARATYKDIGAIKEIAELKREDSDFEKKVEDMLIRVGSAGHASMATTPGFWAFLEGDCSKLVDSMFTVMRFGSALMPSGRRVPIKKDQIVIPSSFNERAQEIYLKASEENIDAYESLVADGVKAQEASKVVQYGHRGGGLLFMPLETLIHFSRMMNSPSETKGIPNEMFEVVRQLEKEIEKKGMEVTYKARQNAPRTGCPHPNIFHSRTNLAEELMLNLELNGLLRLGRIPKILNINNISSEERNKRVRYYLDDRTEIYSRPDRIKDLWPSVLGELEEIVADFNDSISVKTLSLPPWRVWGEVKRHRTLPQTAESIYHAIDRAESILANPSLLHKLEERARFDFLKQTISIPGNIAKDSNKLEFWIERFKNSIRAYREILSTGASESEAVAVIPRGIKLGVIKNFDFYNLTLGYMSLRLCDTAEPEMRSITQKEKGAIRRSKKLEPELLELISPKCAYTGFCPELRGFCPRISEFVPSYNEKFHEGLRKTREDEIREQLSS